MVFHTQFNESNELKFLKAQFLFIILVYLIFRGGNLLKIARCTHWLTEVPSALQMKYDLEIIGIIIITDHKESSSVIVKAGWRAWKFPKDLLDVKVTIMTSQFFQSLPKIFPTLDLSLR